MSPTSKDLRAPGGARLALLLLATLAVACADSRSAPPEEPVAQARQAMWSNGDFEADMVGVSPSGWTVVNYQNNQVTGSASAPPSSFAALNLASYAGLGKLETLIVGGATGTQVDPDLGSAQAFRFPLYGQRAARVNYLSATDSGKNKNANSIAQTMTVGLADIDPIDGQIHVRFAVAPVLENPSHGYTEQPYYFVEVDDLTRGTKLYGDFNTAGQVGVPWKTTTSVVTHNATLWTDWQLVDIAPGNAALAVGDQVKLTVVGSGCSLGGHFGRIYVDGIGSTVPGPFTWATGPQGANAGANLTYTFNYTNGGTGSVIGAHLDFTTPPNTTFQSVSLGSACTAPAVGSAGTVSCPLGTLAPGASGSFTATVAIAASATGSIVNGTYSIAAINAPSLTGAKVVTQLASATTKYADLQVTQTANVSATNWGQPLTYTLKLKNLGPTALSSGSVVFTDAMPAQLTGVTWSCSRTAGSSTSTRCGTSSGSGSISLKPKLGSGGEVTLTVSGTVVAGSGLGAIVNTASSTAGTGTTDPSMANNTAVLSIPIGTPRTLSLTKAGSTANGSVTSAPAGLSCGSSCSSASASFVDGASVLLTATPLSGGSFTGWSGACIGAGATCAVTMNGAQSVTANFAAKPAVGAAANVYAYAGSGQLGGITKAYGSALVALVTDASGSPVPSVTVTFAKPGTGASVALSATTATTNSAGLASVTATANGTAGAFAVTASASGVATPASFALTNVGGAAAITYVLGGDGTDPQLASVGGSFTSPLVALVTDAAGNPVPGAVVTYAAPGSGATATLSSTTATTDASGQSSITAVAGSALGAYLVSASVSGVLTPATFSLQNVQSGPATVYLVSGTPQISPAGSAFPAPLVVNVVDVLGNALSGVTVTFGAPSSGPSATLSSTTVTTDAAGLASVTVTANATPGTYAVSAAVSGLTPVSFSLTNDGTQFIAATLGTPQSAAAGSTFGALLQATVTDANDAPVFGAIVTFVAPTTGARAGLSATTVTTDAAGLASVTATAGTIAGAYTVSASTPNATSPAPFSLTNTPGAAASITAASGSGQSATRGAAMPLPLDALVADAFGNPIPGVLVTFTAPTSGASATLPVATATTDADGHAAVSATAGTTPGTYAVSATVPGVLTPASFTLTNLLAPGTCLRDADCAASEWCDTSAQTCQPKQANGAACGSAAACLSGACDAADGKCGYALGDGTCSSMAQCRSGVCVGSGANAGKCEACGADTDCPAATPVCSASNQCVQCLSGKTAACVGTTPICDTASSACAACNGNFGSVAVHACGSGAPYCNQATGACSASCFSDADCGSGNYCGAGTCQPKQANGAACGSAAACLSGACDAADGKCGYALGDGTCSSTAQCRSGVCVGSCACPSSAHP
jgi:uncharacterized repeat protein (TIGR01451 family)